MEGILHDRAKFRFENQVLICELFTKDEREAQKLGEWVNAPYEMGELENNNCPTIIGTSYKYYIKWYSSDAVELLSKLMKNNQSLINYLNTSCNYYEPMRFRFMKSREDAVTPIKGHVSDSGFDLTILEKVKTSGNVEYYTTGLKIQPPHGYYFDLVPRSSLSKTGYMLANSVGIIDQSYRGPIIAALIKIDPEAKELELPNKCVQIILRPWFNA